MAEAAFTLTTISLQLTLVWRRKPGTVTRVIAGPWLMPLIRVPLRSLFNGWLFGLPPAALVRLIAVDGRWKLLTPQSGPDTSAALAAPPTPVAATTPIASPPCSANLFRFPRRLQPCTTATIPGGALCTALERRAGALDPLNLIRPIPGKWAPA
jgi:hypothetical protein